MRTKGIVAWEGPSLIDGKPITLIITGLDRKNRNQKIGNMLQTWIMRQDMCPSKAFLSGEDFSVCGNCRHRLWGTCYVTVFRSPWNVWRAYKRRSYAKATPDSLALLKGHKVRIGSYGDPAAVPFDVWQKIIENCDGVTGYTHQWKVCDQRLKQYCMASVETQVEVNKALGMGWRYFKVISPGEKLSKDEYVCPASKEGGKKTTCEKCGSCAGLSSKVKKCPLIVAHGQCSLTNRYALIQKKRKNHEAYIPLLNHLFRRKIRKSARQRSRLGWEVLGLPEQKRRLEELSWLCPEDFQNGARKTNSQKIILCPKSE